MKGRGADDDMPDRDERCRECREQYCDGYDEGDPVHKKCVGDPGRGSVVEIGERRALTTRGVKVGKKTMWGLKTPEGWLREGSRGFFTHTKDVRKASRYGTMTKAQKAVGRARHSVEVGAVTYERIRVPKVRERRLVLKEKLPTGDEWLVETERGQFQGTDDKNEATAYSSSHDAVMAKRRAAKVCGGRVKVSEIQVSVEEPLEEVREEDLWPKEPPYFVIAKGKVPGRRYLEALPLTGRAVWTKFHEHAIHYSSYARAKTTLEKMAREDRGGGLHAATVEHIYVEKKTDDEELTPEPRRWAVGLPNGRYALFGGGSAKQVNSTEATKFSEVGAAERAAETVCGTVVEVTEMMETSSGSGKRSEKIRPPAREGNASQGRGVPLHWVVKVEIAGEPHFLKSGRRKKKPIFAENVEDGERWASEEAARGAAAMFNEKHSGKKARAVPVYMTVKPETRRVEVTCPGEGCRASLMFDVVEGDKDLTCPVCKVTFPVPAREFKPGEGLRLGARVVLVGDNAYTRWFGVGHVVGMNAKRDDEDPIEVRWSRRADVSEPSPDDAIGFHKPEDLKVVSYPDTNEVLKDPNDRPGEIKCFGCGKVEKTNADVFPTIGKLWRHLTGMCGWEALEGKALVHCDVCSKRRRARKKNPDLNIMLQCDECTKLVEARTLTKGLCEGCAQSSGMPKIHVPAKVLRGLEEILGFYLQMNVDVNESVKSTKVWIHALGQTLEIPCMECGGKTAQSGDRRCKTCRLKRTRGHYHDLLERAMDGTREGKSLLPKFIELIHEDMLRGDI